MARSTWLARCLWLSVCACGSGAAPAAATSSAARAPVAGSSSGVASAAASAAMPSASSAASNAGHASGRLPFVLFLHGLGASGPFLVDKLGIDGLSKTLGFDYLAPDGDEDSKGQRFWNASVACCDFDRRRPDHSAHLSRILDEKLADPRIDPARVFVVGFSNGGFMAHRLACDDERVVAIGAMGGAGPGPGETCKRTSPLTVLAINGDRDKAVSFGGGTVLSRHDVPPHPSATSTIEAWAQREGCSGTLAPSRTFDLELSIGGSETAVQSVGGCPRPLELWVVHGGGHFSGTSPPAVEKLVAALLAAVPP